MAAFMVGKRLKDQRKIKAIEELFDTADKNGKGHISVSEYVNIFSQHEILVGDAEIAKISKLANEDGKVTKEVFVYYAKTSNFFKSQLDKNNSQSVASKQEANAKAEKAFRLIDKDNNGYITKDEFQKISQKLSREQVVIEEILKSLTYKCPVFRLKQYLQNLIMTEMEF